MMFLKRCNESKNLCADHIFGSYCVIPQSRFNHVEVRFFNLTSWVLTETYSVQELCQGNTFKIIKIVPFHWSSSCSLVIQKLLLNLVLFFVLITRTSSTLKSKRFWGFRDCLRNLFSQINFQFIYSFGRVALHGRIFPVISSSHYMSYMETIKFGSHIWHLDKSLKIFCHTLYLWIKNLSLKITRHVKY